VVAAVEYQPGVDVGGHLGRLLGGVLDLEAHRRRRRRAAPLRERLGERGARNRSPPGWLALLFISSS
jgi:hypothetical protein